MTLRTLLRCALLALFSVNAFTQTIRVGTIAPQGTYWHQVLQETAQEWSRISGGSVRVTIYPGGVQGSETEMLRKVRFHQLQAVALSGAALPYADPSLGGLQIPLLMETNEEFDYILEKMRPKLEENLNRSGFVVLQWSDAGWVHFFTTQPTRTLADVKKTKLFTSAGNPKVEKLLKDFGFNPIPISASELLPALQTGLIDAFDVPPLFALANQSFGLAKNMLDVKWAPLAAATLISRQAWDTLPQELRPKLLEAARQVGDRSRVRIRQLDNDAVAEMTKHGLNVIHVEGSALAEWRAQTEAAYPKLRGELVAADVFDEVIRLRDRYRAGDR